MYFNYSLNILSKLFELHATISGSSLLKVGQSEQRLGHIERDYIASSHHCFLVPLRKFLDGEMKTIMKERSILESKR